MRNLIILIIFLFLTACSKTQFQTPPVDATVTTYVGKLFWASDSLSEAYYYNHYLYISAQKGDEKIVFKIQNPVLGENSNVEMDYVRSSVSDSYASSQDVAVYLNVLDTVNAQPSLINGAFSGLLSGSNGDEIEFKDGKINNAVTNSLFCENIIRSVSSDNTDLGGKWELVKIINRETNEIQNPLCQTRVYLNFYDENYSDSKTAGCDCNFLLEGPVNTLKGNFDTPDSHSIGFTNIDQTETQPSKYIKYFEDMLFESIVNSKAYYIRNTLLQLESDKYETVLYRRD